jgi:hypothetical protein
MYLASLTHFGFSFRERQWGLQQHAIMLPLVTDITRIPKSLQPMLQICYTIADTSTTSLEYGYPTILPQKIHGQHSKTH